MTHGIIAKITCLFMLVSLAGICIAEESPRYTLYMQGGESSLTEDEDGMMITIQDVVPYFFTTIGNQNQLVPVREIVLYSIPMDAALVFSGTDGDATSLVQISNLSLSDEGKTLTLQIKPLEFYEGEMLKAYAKNAIAIETIDKKAINMTELHIDGLSTTPENVSKGYCRELWHCCDEGRCNNINWRVCSECNFISSCCNEP